MLRQGANSAVRFTSYSTLKQLVQGNNTPGSQLPAWLTFGIGASAGVITVCTSSHLGSYLDNADDRYNYAL
jgi:solute carrier family 25 citrate transporter 1